MRIKNSPNLTRKCQILWYIYHKIFRNFLQFKPPKVIRYKHQIHNFNLQLISQSQLNHQHNLPPVNFRLRKVRITNLNPCYTSSFLLYFPFGCLKLTKLSLSLSLSLSLCHMHKVNYIYRRCSTKRWHKSRFR